MAWSKALVHGQVKKLASSEGEPGRKALLASLKTLLSTARQYMSLADLAQLWTGLMEHTAVQIVFLAEALLQTLPGLPKGPLRVRFFWQIPCFKGEQARGQQNNGVSDCIRQCINV